VLGFSALQLSHDAALVTLGDLIDEGRLSDPPAQRSFTVPGDGVTSPALSYLHANCGNCHNGLAVPPGFDLTTRVADVLPQDTGPYRTAVDMPTALFMAPGVTQRIVSGDPDHSAVVVRMNTRQGTFNGQPLAMPPIGTEQIDTAAVQLVSDWITALPH
jgi:hypothetical protein